MERISLTRERLRGQGMVEFAFTAALVVMLLLAVIAFSISAWQRSSIDYELSSLSDELPASWETMTKESLVRYLVLADSSLDPDKLSVSDITIDKRYEVDVNPDDALANAVGSSLSTTTESWVEVTATVSYDVSAPVRVANDPDMTYTRTVHGTYLLDRRYEVS